MVGQTCGSERTGMAYIMSAVAGNTLSFLMNPHTCYGPVGDCPDPHVLSCLLRTHICQLDHMLLAGLDICCTLILLPPPPQNTRVPQPQ